MSPAAQFGGQDLGERPRPLPPATDAVADEDLVAGQLLDRTVEHVVQHRMTLLHVLSEDRMDQLPVDLLVLDRHMPGHHHADDRLAAAPAGAAGLMEDDVPAAGGGNVLAKLFEHLIAASGVLAGGRADLDADRVAGGPLPQRRFGALGQGLELFLNRDQNGLLSMPAGVRRPPAKPMAAIGKHLISAKAGQPVKERKSPARFGVTLRRRAPPRQFLRH